MVVEMVAEMVTEMVTSQVSPFRAHLCLDRLANRAPIQCFHLGRMALP